MRWRDGPEMRMRGVVLTRDGPQIKMRSVVPTRDGQQIEIRSVAPAHDAPSQSNPRQKKRKPYLSTRLSYDFRLFNLI